MPICLRPHCAIRSHHDDITFADFLQLSPHNCELAKTIKLIDNKGFIDDFMFLSASRPGNTEIKCASIIKNRIAEIENEKCLISKRLYYLLRFTYFHHKIKIYLMKQLDHQLNI